MSDCFMPYGVNQSFQYLKKRHRSGVGLLLATYLHWNLIGTSLEPDWNLIGTSSWDKREKYKQDSGLTFGATPRKRAKIKTQTRKYAEAGTSRSYGCKGTTKKNELTKYFGKKVQF